MAKNVEDPQPLEFDDSESADPGVIESSASVKQNNSVESSEQETVTNESVPAMKTNTKEDIKHAEKAPSAGGALSKNMKSRDEQSSDVDTKDREGGDAVHNDTDNPESGHETPRWKSSGVETYAIQCNSCYKWRIIPTKEKYEAIGEHNLERPFVCTTAQEWRKSITCRDPADLDENEPSVLWAIDKHNIPCPPPGFYRKAVLRGENAKKFADIYYRSPCGKTLRSTVEVRRYLEEHPDLNANVSQFSFTSPKAKAEAMGASNRSPWGKAQSGTDARKRSKDSTLNPQPIWTKARAGAQPALARPQVGDGTPVKPESQSVTKRRTARQEKPSLQMEKAITPKGAQRPTTPAVKREKL